MKIARLSNVPIKDLLIILTRLSTHYEMVDIVIDPDNKKVIIEPIDIFQDDSELTDENIYKLI